MITDVMKTENIDDLLHFVCVFGVPTSVDAICHMQDVVGHTSVETLSKICNNDYGEKDCYGHPTVHYASQMFSLLFHIWNWEDAVRFWNLHVNPEHKKVAELEKENKAIRTQLEQKQAECETVKVDGVENEEKLGQAEKRIEELEAEVLKLKAMMFDMMMKDQK